jgi:hypothetical protein
MWQRAVTGSVGLNVADQLAVNFDAKVNTAAPQLA